MIRLLVCPTKGTAELAARAIGHLSRNNKGGAGKRKASAGGSPSSAFAKLVTDASATAVAEQSMTRKASALAAQAAANAAAAEADSGEESAHSEVEDDYSSSSEEGNSDEGAESEGEEGEQGGNRRASKEGGVKSPPQQTGDPLMIGDP